LGRNAGVLELFAPGAKLLGRYVSVKAQVEQALLLEVYLGYPL